MSKCSSCNQPLPDPVRVFCKQWERFFGDYPDRFDSVEATLRTNGRESAEALERLAQLGQELILVTASQYDELKAGGPSSDWDVHQLACAKQTVEDLRKRNAELVRKLDTVRREAKL